MLQSLEIDTLPEIDCPGIDTHEVSDLLCGVRDFPDDIFIVDRGNRLTDYLGMHAVQVLIPDLEYLDRQRPGPSGLPFPVA